MINRAGLELIKQFEGFRAETYLDPIGIATIGYGTTKAAGVGIDPQPGMRVTEKEAETYLLRAIDKFAAHIDPLFKSAPNENERAAMLSLAYNIGPGAFAKSSVLKRFNEGNKQAAADAFLLWTKAGGKTLAGLKRRREAERALFLEPVINIPKPQRKSITQSRTAQASAASLMGGVGVVGTAASQIGALSETAQVLLIGFGIVCAVAAVIIFRERLRKWAEGVR